MLLSVHSWPAPASPCTVLCVVYNSPARWRGAAGSLFEPITHPVRPQQAVGRTRGNWPKPHPPAPALTAPWPSALRHRQLRVQRVHQCS